MRPFPRSRQFVAGAAVAVLAALAAAVWTAGASAQEEPQDVRITAVTGDVDVKMKGDAEWTPADANTPIETGDAIRTGAASTAEISFGGQSLYELQENSNLTLAEAGSVKTVFNLDLGTLLLHIRKLMSGQSTEVKTTVGVAAVIGTELAVSVAPDGATGVACFDGEVLFETKAMPGIPGKQVKLPKDRELELKLGAAPETPRPLKVFLERKARFKALNARRIVLRRDWQPMAREQRQEFRAKLVEARAKRLEKRKDHAPGPKPGQVKPGGAPGKAPGKGPGKRRGGRGRKKK